MVMESDLVVFKKGDILCAHGDPADHVMYVLRGEVAMEHSPGLLIEYDGKIVTFKKGALIGEGSAILKRPYMGTCVGFTDGAYARVQADRIRAEVARCAKLPRMIIETQARKLDSAFAFIMKNYKALGRGEIDEVFKPDHGFGDFFEESRVG